MRRRGGSRFLNEESEAEVNLTSLIDVVFVVLIMFIIVAPLLEMEQVSLSNASTKRDKEFAVIQETSPISIYVKKDNSIYLGKIPISLEQLPKLLRSLKEKNPRRTPQLFHDKEAFFGTYQSVKNALEEAGFEEVDLILNPR